MFSTCIYGTTPSLMDSITYIQDLTPPINQSKAIWRVSERRSSFSLKFFLLVCYWCSLHGSPSFSAILSPSPQPPTNSYPNKFESFLSNHQAGFAPVPYSRPCTGLILPFSSYRLTASAQSWCCCFCVYLFVLLGLFVVPLSPVYSCFSVWVPVTQYSCEITFNGDSGFVASVPRAIGPASLEALPPHTFILTLYFRLPKSYCICVFIF